MTVPSGPRRADGPAARWGAPLRPGIAGSSARPRPGLSFSPARRSLTGAGKPGNVVMKVVISADMEGTTGVTCWAETERDKPDYPEFQALMTAEVTAACNGALDADATGIIVKDAHHTGRNLLVDRLPAEVRIVRHWSGHPHSMMFGVDGDCAAAIYTGCHDAAGTDSNPLAHSFTGRIMQLR